MPRPILSSVEVLEKNLESSKVQNLNFLEIFRVSDPRFSRIKILNTGVTHLQGQQVGQKLFPQDANGPLSCDRR